MVTTKNMRKLWCNTNLLILICAVTHFILGFYFLSYNFIIPAIYSFISTAIHCVHLAFYRKLNELKSYMLVLIQIDLYALLFSLYFKESAGCEFIMLALIPATFFLTYKNVHSPIYYVITLVPTMLIGVFITVFYNYSPNELPYPLSFYHTHQIACMTGLSIILIYLSLATERELLRTNRKNDIQREALIYTANHDPLTKLVNRRRMWECLHQVQKEKKQTGKRYILSIFDIDNFKQVNDMYGHDAGDTVLRETAALIKSKLPPDIKLARWGGEEFMLLFFNGTDKSTDFIEGIRKIVESNVIHYKNMDISITMTFGVSSSDFFDDVELVIIDADKALIEGKRGTKNCITISDTMKKVDATV